MIEVKCAVCGLEVISRFGGDGISFDDRIAGCPRQADKPLLLLECDAMQMAIVAAERTAKRAKPFA